MISESLFTKHSKAEKLLSVGLPVRAGKSCKATYRVRGKNAGTLFYEPAGCIIVCKAVKSPALIWKTQQTY